VHERESVLDEQLGHHKDVYDLTEDDRELANRSIQLKYHDLVIRGRTMPLVICENHHKKLIRQHN
jgi:hypothetical protein